MFQKNILIFLHSQEKRKREEIVTKYIQRIGMTSGIFEIDDDFQKEVGPCSDDDEISEEVN